MRVAPASWSAASSTEYRGQRSRACIEVSIAWVASGTDTGGSGDPKEDKEDKAPKVSLQTRIALIGVLGALAGTLVGGLITWVVTQDQIASQRADARRAERLDAYSEYFADAARLWTQVFTIYEVTPRPTRLSQSETAALKALQETLTREYALVTLLAPERVHNVARELNAANTDVWNALQSYPINQKLYRNAKKRANALPTNLLQEFLATAKKDLGTEDQ